MVIAHGGKFVQWTNLVAKISILQYKIFASHPPRLIT